jgi:hypothetical protein
MGSTLALAHSLYYDRLVQLASTIKFVHQILYPMYLRLQRVFASSCLTLCSNNRIYICTLSIDGNMNNVLALRVCLVT